METLIYFPRDREEHGVVSMVMPQTLERNKDRIRDKCM